MLRRGSGTTSKSLGDLPEFREDNWIQKPDADDEDHWTGLPAPRSSSSSSKNRDLFEDNEPLPDPEYRSSSKGFSLPLFGGKKGGSLVNEGEKLSPSKYDAVREGPERSLSLEEALEETAFSDPTIKKRERSKSLGGRLKSAFSAFSSKYEALTRPGDPTIPGLEDAPIRGEDETTFKGVHFSKDERGSKIHEEHIVTAIFSAKGLFLEEQPSGDYVDDIPPSVVTKYVVDPKTGSFNLLVSRKSRYSSTQIEYTVSLTSKHFETMMGCWKDVIKAGEPLSPRSTALKDDKKKRKNKNSPQGSPVFGEDEEGSPRRDRGGGGSKSSSGSVPINSRTVPRSTTLEQPSPKKQELLIDL